MRIKNFILCTAALTGLDQVVKWIIQTYFLDTRFDIIPGLLEFYPKYNYSHSYVNDLFDIGIGFAPHLLLFLVILAWLILMYGYIRTIRRKKIDDCAYMFGIAGAVSAILSISLWKGVLDFIYLVSLFVFDLKDLYINVFVVLFIAGILFYRSEPVFNGKGKGFLNYIKNLFTKAN